MKLSCELCGGLLRMEPGGGSALCTACGLGYSVERLRELLGVRKAESEPEDPPGSLPLGRREIADGARRAGGFLLIVEDVYRVTGRGADVLGTVEQGSIAVGDHVAVNEKGSYPVIAIEHKGRMQERAGKGMPVGLCLSGLDAGSVSPGDVITSSGCAEPVRANGDIIYEVVQVEYLHTETEIDGTPLAELKPGDICTEPFSMYISKASCKAREGKWMLEVYGKIQSGCVANLDTVFLNGDEKSRWAVVSVESQSTDPVYHRACAGMDVKLRLMGEKRAEISNAVSLWGVATPTESADHFFGTPQQFFAALLARDFRDFDVWADVRWGGVTRPISFLLCQGGKPQIALFMLDSWDGPDRWQVEKSMEICRGLGVTALQFFNDYRNEAAYVVRRIRQAL